jgi:hypothetical protein
MLSASPFFKGVLLLSLLSVDISCKSQKQMQETSDQGNSELMFRYSRGACFGVCPVFDIYVYTSGKALFRGRHYAPRRGHFAAQVESDILDKFQRNIQKLQGKAIDTRDETQPADMPAYKIGFHVKDKWTTFEGNGEVPDELGDLEDMVLDLVDNAGWQSVDPQAFDVTKAEDKPEEIIVQLTADADIKVLEERYADYQFTALKHLSPNLPYWLITFDVRSIEPEAMLALIKRDPLVVEAEFNKKVEMRE